MCYSLYRSLLTFRSRWDFCLIPTLYARFPDFYTNILSLFSSVTVTYVGESPNIFYICGHGDRTRNARMRGERTGLCWRQRYFADVHKKLFWIVIYCAKPRNNPGSNSGSWSLRGPRRQYPRTIQE